MRKLNHLRFCFRSVRPPPPADHSRRNSTIYGSRTESIKSMTYGQVSSQIFESSIRLTGCHARSGNTTVTISSTLESRYIYFFFGGGGGGGTLGGWVGFGGWTLPSLISSGLRGSGGGGGGGGFAGGAGCLGGGFGLGLGSGSFLLIVLSLLEQWSIDRGYTAINLVIFC